MDNGHQAATKQDLLELENRLRQELGQGLGDLEKRLVENLRQSETKILRAFYGYAEATHKHLADLEGSDSSLRLRLGFLETRLTEVERRLNMPPPKGSSGSGSNRP